MRLKNAVPMLMLLLLCACGAAKESAQTPVRFRTGLREAGSCTFRLTLRADYGDFIRDFTLDCTGQPDGDASLTVVEPEAAKGIKATVHGEDAEVGYLGTVLAVEAFSSRPISPMAAPYLLTHAWSEGYIQSCGRDGETEQVTYLMGYGQRQLTVTTWFQEETPIRAELSDGKQVLIFCDIENFSPKKKVSEHEGTENAETDVGGG